MSRSAGTGGAGTVSAVTGGEWRHQVNNGAQQHQQQQQSPARSIHAQQQYYAPAPGSGAGNGNSVAVSVVGHPAFHHHPEAGGPHALHVGLPAGVGVPTGSVPILSLVSPTLFAPTYAFLTQFSVPGRGVGGTVAGANGTGGGVGNGTINGVSGEGKSTGGQRGGERGGNDRDRERADLRGNHLAAHGRIPLHESSMPIEQQQQPRARLRKQAPTGLVVLATAPGAMPDNRDQVIARAREMERQRRLEGRTTCYTSEPVPEIHGVTVASPAADLVGQFKDISRRKLDGSSDEVDMMVGWGPAPPRGVVDADSCWPLPRVVGRRSSSGGDRSDTRSDRSDSGGGRTPTDDGNGTPTASLTGAVSSVARSDGDGWGVISSSVSPSPSSSSSCGEGSIRGSRGSRGGRRGSSCWGEGTICESAAICSASVSAMSGSATGSASGSASGDVDGDRSLSGEEPPWCEELASSIGVVTDLVLPSPMSRAGGFGPPRRGRGYMKESRWGVDVGGDDDDDEEEREMDAALERMYKIGREQLHRHDNKSAKARQRVTENWLASRTPQQRTEYRSRRQR
ncbi:unnamed protein product [Sphacelaria rigidula]